MAINPRLADTNPENPQVIAAEKAKNGTQATRAVTPKKATRTVQMPPLPDDYFWRVNVREDETYGTVFIVSLRQRLRFGSKKIDSTQVAANEFGMYFQGSTLSDPETIARTAEAIWKNRSDTISRRANYGVRAKNMRRYKGDYDEHHTLDEVIA